GNDAQSVKRVDLVLSNIDATDFYLPNGAFRATQYEILSYITNSKMRVDAKNYLHPVSGLPESETQGFQTLYKGKTTSNLPKLQGDYVIREKPEHRLYDELVQDNQHRIITLIGRGGIGKTWLALKVLEKISNE